MGACVRDLMAPAHATVDASASVVDAARWMRDHDDQEVAVCDPGGMFLGMVTALDLLYGCVAEGSDPTATSVADVISPDTVRLAPGQSIEEAMDTLLHHHWRLLPVVDRGRLVGMLGVDQITAHLLEAEDLSDDWSPDLPI